MRLGEALRQGTSIQTWLGKPLRQGTSIQKYIRGPLRWRIAQDIRERIEKHVALAVSSGQRGYFVILVSKLSRCPEYLPCLPLTVHVCSMGKERGSTCLGLVVSYFEVHIYFVY